MSDTELKLKFWRGDQIGAERLAATILHIDGFSSVDPQCPLGGPDGLKDVRCEKNGWRYVAAAYFSIAEQKFKAIQDKFKHDLEGVSTNSANGLVFITNQPLTPGERDTLANIADAAGHKSILYHLERLRSILDSPSGYGARLEFLDIDMSREEQLSFFSQWNRTFADQLQAHSLLIIRELSKKIDLLAEASQKYGAKMGDVSEFAQQTRSLMASEALPSNKKTIGDLVHEFATRNLDLDGLCMLHRALLFDAPMGAQVGKLRTQRVWIGKAGVGPDGATFVPPDPEHVPRLIDELLTSWRTSFDAIVRAPEQDKIAAIARFHHQFLSIHPFMDGNGRIARFLLSQHARELLGRKHRVTIEDRLPYFDALAKADSGDYSALETHITQAIFGVEFVGGSPCQMSGQACPGCREGIMDVEPTGTGVECRSCDLFIPAIPQGH